ncbi:MAG: hypothetical protein MUE32_02270 [Bacteroidales bacterium]|jgi:hypothetical protein|nr:hypothetical protein [Bacteroidales bacterium]
MSSRRDLKKDIDYLVYELLSDCFIYSDMHPGENIDELSSIIAEAVDLRNDLIARVNNPDGAGNPKLIRAYYKAVEKNMNEGVDKLFTRLSKITSR